MAGAQLAQGLGQRDAIKQQNEIAKGIAKTNERNAIEAAARDSQVFAQQEKQADFQATTAAREKSVEAALVKGASRAGSGSAGVEGLSIETLEADFQIQEHLAQGNIETQREFQQQSIQQGKDQLTARTQNRINASAPNLAPVPTVFGTLIGVAGAAAQGYSLGNSIVPK